jgi:hypothetical protein
MIEANSSRTTKSILAAANNWFSAARITTTTAVPIGVSGRVTIHSLSEYADLVHDLARQTLVLRGFPQFQKFVRPRLFGVADGFVLPRADWAPMSREGRILAIEAAIDIEKFSAILKRGSLENQHAMLVDERVQNHPDQRVIVIGTSDNWFDFIVYYLTRFLAVIEYGFLSDGWSIALGMGQAGLFRPVLKLLDIPEDRVIWLEDDRAHYFPRALYISNINSIEGSLHPLAIKLLRDSLPGKPRSRKSTSGERVFVSRMNTGRRRLLNELELHPGLIQRGFTIVHPEMLPFEDQVNTFQGARDIAGVHGAALVNAVWSQRPIRLLEITYGRTTDRELTLDKAVRKMVGTLGGRHRFLRAHSEETLSPGNHLGDFRIDSDRFFSEFDVFMT